MKFGPKLRKLRDLRRRSQQEIADHLGVSQNLVSCWERGKNPPHVVRAKLLADYLEVSLDYLADEARGELPAESDWDLKLRFLLEMIGPEEACRRILRKAEDAEIRQVPKQPPRLAKDGDA